MSVVLLLSLVGLALVDSTSVGTLFIPVWLLLAPQRIGARRLLGYLATIAAFYFAVGVVLLLLGTSVDVAASSRPFLIAQLVVGLALFALSFWVDRRKSQAAAAIVRWRDRAISGAAAGRGLAALALLAAAAEVATMLPYLGAIGLLVTSAVPLWESVVVLAGYCVVMIVPALVLYGVRVAGAAWIERTLERMSAWMLAKGGGLLSWVLGIAGFVVARDAAARLWFPELLGGA